MIRRCVAGVVLGASVLAPVRVATYHPVAERCVRIHIMATVYLTRCEFVRGSVLPR